MMKLIILALSVLASVLCHADETPKEDPIGPWGAVALLEGIVLANAAMATEAPKELGWGLTLVSPFALGNKGSTYTKVVGAVGLAALGQYNAQELSDERQYSKSDIFKNNIYAFHVVGAIAFLTEWLTCDEEVSENIAILPSKNGFALALNYEL